MKRIIIKLGAYLFYALLFLGFFAFGYWLVTGCVKEIKEKIIWYRVHREVKKNLENSSLHFDPSLDIRGQKRSTTYPIYVDPMPSPTSMPNNTHVSPIPQPSVPTGMWVKKPCNFCRSTGKNPGKTYSPYYGGDRQKNLCHECGDYDYPHHHGTCPSCGGKGYIEDYINN